MRKFIYMLGIALVLSFMFSTPVFAATQTCSCYYYSGGETFTINGDSTKTCRAICNAAGGLPVTSSKIDGGDTIDCGEFVEITKPIAQIVMIAAPILLLVLGTVDFLKAVAASDEKAMKKATSDFVKRLLICVIILILPLLINMIMGWVKFQDLTACF